MSAGEQEPCENEGACSLPIVLPELKSTDMKCITFPDIKCAVIVPTAAMLSHLILDHSKIDFKNEIPIEFAEMFRTIKYFTSLRPGIVKFGRKVVISTLMYGGIKGETKTLPVTAGLCERNVNLPENWTKYDEHLPVFFMACRTSNCAFTRDAQLPEGSRDLKKDVYIFWLASVPTKKPMFGQIIAFSGNFMRCDARVSLIRDITASQDAATILGESQNYLMLTHSEMRALSYLGTKQISFRIGVSDNEQELLDEGRVSFHDVQFPVM